MPFIQVPNEGTIYYATLARIRGHLTVVIGQAVLLIVSRSYVFVKQSLLFFAKFLYLFLMVCVCCVVFLLMPPFYFGVWLFTLKCPVILYEVSSIIPFILFILLQVSVFCLLLRLF